LVLHEPKLEFIGVALVLVAISVVAVQGQEDAPVLAGGLALVPGHVVPGAESGAGGRATHGGPLHVPSVHRIVDADLLGGL
jgi:hypothetical protein